MLVVTCIYLEYSFRTAFKLHFRYISNTFKDRNNAFHIFSAAKKAYVIHQYTNKS